MCSLSRNRAVTNVIITTPSCPKGFWRGGDEQSGGDTDKMGGESVGKCAGAGRENFNQKRIRWERKIIAEVCEEA